MGTKTVLIPADEIDLSAVKYEYEQIDAPHLTGSTLRLFVWLLEAPVIGSMIISYLRKKNKMVELLKNTVIPESPMFKPEYPPQEPEKDVAFVEDAGRSEERVAQALKCLSEYDPSGYCDDDLAKSFRYWKIRDFSYAYRTKLATPSLVAEKIILALEEFNKANPTTPLLIAFDAEDVRVQAAASTQRFEEGKSLSVLDGIFMAIKDDIDCYPYPSNGATTWYHDVRSVKKDAVSVSKLRSCGVIFIGKANMHELGLGTTGNNANYGTTRNPHAHDRYTGGSSSGPAAIVASGLCSAALGTDGGGSIRIPSSLCGVVGLKTTYGRIDKRGALCDGTVEIVGPIASSVEDVMLVYAAVLGSSPADTISMKPSPPCLPNLASEVRCEIVGSLRLGKYTEWFNDVCSSEISLKCDDVLNWLCEKYNCQTEEIAIPELSEMRTAHIVSIGSEALCSLNPDCEDGKNSKLTYDTRTNLALFRSFSATDYVAAQKIRRRMMYYHMEIFKKVDVIVTPTTGMTAPAISSSALKCGESNLQVSGYLMRFIVAGNLLGLPAITIPIGYDKQGLPIGLQLIGRPWGEATLLRLAFCIEESYGINKKRPALYYDILKGT
ncbi:fatty acid amide hydrolase [Amaranthus tricolor]|uniref:fatty acid amide hydrolase n=1 Tax=Amaranthus tricolor TaxID=29722 RepID=UPI0025837849|nr:fatty acid amide hydrolase [Amaranthus tricolor]